MFTKLLPFNTVTLAIGSMLGECLNQILGLHLTQKSSYGLLNMCNWKADLFVDRVTYEAEIVCIVNLFMCL